MGNSNTNIQVSQQNTHIQASDSKLELHDQKTATLQSTQLLISIGAIIIVALILLLLFSLILNCYLCNRLKKKNGYLKRERKISNLRDKGLDKFILDKPNDITSGCV
ncbi:NSP1-1 [Rotavirus G chicken/03V0567/DEU/2003]|uniref:NSP1-1 n=1 Tax=Rotavirus G chicken/03V0567/DEU/2003 TaxID=994995 RepID=M4H298_9REOV|nr:NSP1-1 [Rotavirus G chicken/03V0567/DEU/2003]AFL91897.1 NSP1-1 [Rotavirus G chicken/03V0567/DEU/2003]